MFGLFSSVRGLSIGESVECLERMPELASHPERSDLHFQLVASFAITLNDEACHSPGSILMRK